MLFNKFCTVQPCFMDTRLVRTPCCYRHFALPLGKAIFSKFNLLNMDTQGSQICQIWCILHRGEGTGSLTLTPEIFGNKHSFVLTFFTTNTIYVNCKRCKP